MSLVSPKVDKKSKEYQTQLEDAIIRYQKALETNNQRAIDMYYNKICIIYPPNLHIQEWYNQYYYLYDSYDDFSIEYMKIFCNVLSNWQPRNLRKVSRYGGSGEFKNYFIGALHHNYINLVKADNAAKRNPSCKCPICDKYVSPLSTHLRKAHSDILWNHMNNSGFDLETLDHCPFCKSFKTPRTIECTCETVKDDCEICKKNALKEAIKKHLLSKHSTLLFQNFLCGKKTTLSVKGGNSQIYSGTGLQDKLDSLIQQHPDVVKGTFKFKKVHHQVDYTGFKDNKIILKKNIKIPVYPEMKLIKNLKKEKVNEQEEDDDDEDEEEEEEEEEEIVEPVIEPVKIIKKKVVKIIPVVVPIIEDKPDIEKIKMYQEMIKKYTDLLNIELSKL